MSGGTDFYVASQALVECANGILKKHPTYQVLFVFVFLLIYTVSTVQTIVTFQETTFENS